MGIGSKVFAFFNVIIVVVFLIFTAPVVDARLDTREKIEAAAKRVADLEGATRSLDAERLELQQQTEAALADATDAKTIGDNRRSEFDALVAELQDDRNDAASVLATANASLAEVNQNIELRTREVGQFQSELAKAQDENDSLTQDVQRLSSTLDRRRLDFQQTMKKIDEAHQQLVERAEQPAGREVARP